MSCIFMSCYLVGHFHVLQFHALQLGPSISCPAISCLSFSAPPPPTGWLQTSSASTVLKPNFPSPPVPTPMQSRIFHPCILVCNCVLHTAFPPSQSGAAFSSPAFSCLAFSASPYQNYSTTFRGTPLINRKKIRHKHTQRQTTVLPLIPPLPIGGLNYRPSCAFLRPIHVSAMSNRHHSQTGVDTLTQPIHTIRCMNLTLL